MGKQEWISVPSSRRNSKNSRSIPNNSIEKLARRREWWISLLLISSFVATFVVGKLLWTEQHYSAESGLGYYFGLTGGVMMLFAYAYMFVKYIPALRRSGLIVFSLRTHIVFAVVGSYLVLLHSSFKIGSLNSGVAFISMLLVFISGVVGRYLYTRTHYGISRAKASLVELDSFLIPYKENELLAQSFQQVQQAYLKKHYSFFSALTGLFRYPFIRAKLKAALLQSGDLSRQLVREYLANVKKVALFSLYERLFNAWRHIHAPLLLLLFLSGVIHVIAVHIY